MISGLKRNGLCLDPRVGMDMEGRVGQWPPFQIDEAKPKGKVAFGGVGVLSASPYPSNSPRRGLSHS